jgi:hypothetical protein
MKGIFTRNKSKLNAKYTANPRKTYMFPYIPGSIVAKSLQQGNSFDINDTYPQAAG